MSEASIVVLGLPSSGKTTYLAALWHVLLHREIGTALRFDRLPVGDRKYLNQIADRWRDAYVQERTATSGTHVVKLLLKNESGDAVALTFPDAPGEEFRDMWELRTCDQSMLEHLKATAVVLFIHADEIEAPRWIVDQNHIIQAFKGGTQASVDETADNTADSKTNDEAPAPAAKEWTPRLAPTQVQLVGLLQLLMDSPLDVGPRRLAVVFSAWDLVADDELTPDQFMAVNLPLLSQFLGNNRDLFVSRCYGISAQGGKYDADENTPASAEADAARQKDRPSDRIQVMDAVEQSRDLTIPLQWLLSEADDA